MATQQAIIDGVYTKLTTDQSAGTPYALTGGRIFNGEPDPNETVPYLAFDFVTDVPRRSFTNENLDDELQVDIYGTTAAGRKVTRTIADAVFTLLDRASITATNWAGVSAQCVDRGSPVKEEDAFRITQRYRVTGTATA